MLDVNASARIQTYDVEFNAYLEDFRIRHEQFLVKDRDKFYLFSKKKSGNFIQINCLLTSTSNPKFQSSPYDSIENQIRLQLNDILLNIQIEVLSSMIQYVNNVQEKISKLPTNPSLQSSSSSTESSSSSSSNKPSQSFKIDVRFDEISLLIGSNISQLLFLQLKTFNAFLSKTNIQIISHVFLTDFYLIDLHPQSTFQYLISKENSREDFIQFDMSVYTYPKNFRKRPQDLDSFIRGQVHKLNIVFLYKHIRLLMSILDSFQTKEQSKPPPPSDEPNFLVSSIDIYEKNALEFHLDFTLNAPKIFIPYNSYSNEGLNVDLGKLVMHTDLNTISFKEKHSITYENLSVERSFSDGNKQINLLKSSPFRIAVNRQADQENQEITAEIRWDTIQFHLGKADYAAIQRILQENFREKILSKVTQVQSTDEQQPSNQPPTKNELSTQIRLNFQIKEISLTLYLDENPEQGTRDDNSKLIYVTIEAIQASFQQPSNSNYQGNLQIQQLYANDCRLHQQNQTFAHFINKGFDVDQNTPLINIDLHAEKSTRTGNFEDEVNHMEEICLVNGQMESFLILVNADLINSMFEFLNYELSSNDQRKTIGVKTVDIIVPSPAKYVSKYQPVERKNSSLSLHSTAPARLSQASDSLVETKVELVLKPWKIVLIEDPKNNDSNCLVVNVSFVFY